VKAANRRPAKVDHDYQFIANPAYNEARFTSLKLQRPLADGKLKILATGVKKDAEIDDRGNR